MDEDQVGYVAKQALTLRSAKRAHAAPQLPCLEVVRSANVRSANVGSAPWDACFCGHATVPGAVAGGRSPVGGRPLLEQGAGGSVVAEMEDSDARAVHCRRLDGRA